MVFFVATNQKRLRVIGSLRLPILDQKKNQGIGMSNLQGTIHP